MTSTWEIHYFVSRFNWDDNTTILSWISDSQLCDRATAAMIFWRSAPDFYTKYNTEEEADADYGGTIYKLVRNILSKWEAGFYVNQQIGYNPYTDVGEEVNYVNPEAKWSIPEYLKASIPGEEIIVEK